MGNDTFPEILGQGEKVGRVDDQSKSSSRQRWSPLLISKHTSIVKTLPGRMRQRKKLCNTERWYCIHIGDHFNM